MEYDGEVVEGWSDKCCGNNPMNQVPFATSVEWVEANTEVSVPTSDLGKYTSSLVSGTSVAVLHDPVERPDAPVVADFVKAFPSGDRLPLLVNWGAGSIHC